MLVVSQHHLHNTAPLPLVPPVVVAMNDPHVTDVTLLMHQHLTTLLARVAQTLWTVGCQVGWQVAWHGALLPRGVCPAGWTGPSLLPLGLRIFLPMYC